MLGSLKERKKERLWKWNRVIVIFTSVVAYAN